MSIFFPPVFYSSMSCVYEQKNESENSETCGDIRDPGSSCFSEILYGIRLRAQAYRTERIESGFKMAPSLNRCANLGK